MGIVQVLVVDDQELYRRAMAAVVEETDGFVVVGEASNGESSVEASTQLHPDLVLMDVNLPGIDGLEATRQNLRRGRRRRGRLRRVGVHHEIGVRAGPASLGMGVRIGGAVTGAGASGAVTSSTRRP